ncbi:MAG: hypothetical protein KTR16_06415, partial [Acidiferrobacterales bacterium]|nr:hypothetical protein [Acidiferrobacterales bacterium]
MASRAIQSFLIAALVTLGLIYAMYALIRMAEPELGERNQFKLPEFVHVPKNEEVNTITPKPDRPDDIAEQPDVPDVDVTPDKIDINTNLALGAVQVGINRELQGFNAND